jgi:hypothetical protein
MVILNVVLILQTQQRPLYVGYSDIHGEITYREASSFLGEQYKDASNFTDALAFVNNNPVGYVGWKRLLDFAVTDTHPDQKGRALEAIQTLVSSKVKGSNQRLAMRIANNYSAALSTVWNQFDFMMQKSNFFPKNFFNASGYALKEATSQEKKLFSLNLYTTRVENLRELSKNNFEPLVFEYRYYCAVASLTYNFTGESSRKVNFENILQNFVSEMRKINSDFPSEPSPYYWLATKIKDKQVARKYATEYIRLEKRSWKKDWLTDARKLIVDTK